MCFAQSPNICIKKKVLVVYVVFFVCFEVFLSFLKSFVYFFFIKDSIFGIFCLYFVHREKNISQLFICKYWYFSSRFLCQLCPQKHLIFKFCCFFSFVLISCKKSRTLRSHICDPSELVHSSFRFKKTV